MLKMKNILEIIIILLLIGVLIKLNFAQDINRYEVIKNSDLADIILLDKKTGLTWRTNTDDAYIFVNMKYVIPPTDKVKYNKNDFVLRIKYLFPEYKKMDNDELFNRLIMSYPQYKEAIKK